jgi:hypothetical protein
LILLEGNGVRLLAISEQLGLKLLPAAPVGSGLTATPSRELRRRLDAGERVTSRSSFGRTPSGGLRHPALKGVPGALTRDIRERARFVLTDRRRTLPCVGILDAARSSPRFDLGSRSDLKVGATRQTGQIPAGTVICACASGCVREERAPVPDRYFLHVKENDELFEDPEGTELVDLNAARTRAVVGGREILAERIVAGRPIDGLEIIICDTEGRVLEQVGFADLVVLRGG